MSKRPLKKELEQEIRSLYALLIDVVGTTCKCSKASQCSNCRVKSFMVTTNCKYLWTERTYNKYITFKKAMDNGWIG